MYCFSEKHGPCDFVLNHCIKVMHRKVTNFVETSGARISVILSVHSHLTDTMPRLRHTQGDICSHNAFITRSENLAFICSGNCTTVSSSILVRWGLPPSNHLCKPDRISMSSGKCLNVLCIYMVTCYSIRPLILLINSTEIFAFGFPGWWAPCMPMAWRRRGSVWRAPSYRYLGSCPGRCILTKASTTTRVPSW